MGRETTAQVVRGLKILKRRLAQEIRVDRMILFGSRARDDWLLHSDADLMVVSPDFGGLRFADRSTEVLCHWRGRVDLEVFLDVGRWAAHARRVWPPARSGAGRFPPRISVPARGESTRERRGPSVPSVASCYSRGTSKGEMMSIRR